MDKERSEDLCARIANLIAREAPYVEYDLRLLNEEKKKYSPEDFARLKEQGLYDGDFEKYYVISQLLQVIPKEERDREFDRQLMRSARKFLPAEFRADPFIRHVKVKEAKKGNFLLTNATYAKGELFQYAMPDLDKDVVVPKIGFFTGEVTFPAVYEDEVPWMSACPSEISSMKEQMEEAHGRVLVLGLGLGYYPYVVARKRNVESVTIIERSREVIELFEENILPQFTDKEKIRIVEADAFEYLKGVSANEYDYCFADIWENQFDGAKAYEKIKPHEKKLPATKFSYWIEKEILWYLAQEERD